MDKPDTYRYKPHPPKLTGPRGNVGPQLFDDSDEATFIVHIFDGPGHRPQTCRFCKVKESDGQA